MGQTQQCKHGVRLLWLAVLLLWLCVTVTAFAFHHHEDGKECHDVSCPFFLVLVNLPFLVISIIALLLPETPAIYIPYPGFLLSLWNKRPVCVRGPPCRCFS